MNVKEYMKLPYNFVIKPIEDESGSYFHAAVLELEGCQSSGATVQEACDNLMEAMECWIEAKIENGFPVSVPMENDRFSGKFLVRIPRSLHARLASEAEREGVSLNQYALYKLSC